MTSHVPQPTNPPQQPPTSPQRQTADRNRTTRVPAIRRAFAARLQGYPQACAIVIDGLLLAIKKTPPRACNGLARYPIGALVVRIADGLVLDERVSCELLIRRIDFESQSSKAWVGRLPRFETVRCAS